MIHIILLPIYHTKHMSSSKIYCYVTLCICCINSLFFVRRIDGLKRGPIDLGAFDQDDWHSVARPAVQARFDKYSTSETHFTLLKICTKRRFALERLISSLQDQLVQLGEGEECSRCEGDIAKYEGLLRQEIEKESSEAAENVRRRHNYVPLVVEVMVALAKAGKIGDMMRAAAQSTASMS